MDAPGSAEHRPGVPRRRDRHGRGLRGPLAPPHVPINRSRAERFDDLVLDALDRLKPRWGRELAAVELAVEDVPPLTEMRGVHARDAIPLSRHQPAQGAEPAVITVYRRPIEARAGEPENLGALIQAVVVEEVANLLGLAPDAVDPGYDEND